MNDFSSGLTLTVLGMGLVFFSLIVVLFLIKGLDKLFPARGEDVDGDVTPPANFEPVAASEEPPAAVVTIVAAPRSDLEMLVGGRRHAVTMKDLDALPMLVIVDGDEHRVERIDGDQLVVDGRSFTVRVLESADDHVGVGVGDDVFRVDLPAALVEPLTAPVAPAASGLSSSAAVSAEMVNAPLPGKILRVSVRAGERVKRGQELCVIEAMKMENSIGAPRDGVVRDVQAQAGALVRANQALVTLE